MRAPTGTCDDHGHVSAGQTLSGLKCAQCCVSSMPDLGGGGSCVGSIILFGKHGSISCSVVFFFSSILQRVGCTQSVRRRENSGKRSDSILKRENVVQVLLVIAKRYSITELTNRNNEADVNITSY